MAAPNIVGPHGSDQVGPEEPDPEAPDQSLPSVDGARAERIAELASRLAAIETRDNGSASRSRTGSSSPPGAWPLGATGDASSGVQGGASGGPGVGGDRDADGTSAGAGGVGTAGVARIMSETASRSRSAAPIGSSGSSGRRRGEPGGHPEDAPGDPETVAKAICLRLLTAAARPRAALESALRQKGIPDQVADTVLNRFVEVGLIDDQAYAETFVTVKHRERALGATALLTELRRKGVDDAIATAAVQTVDQDAERERAAALISRRVDAAMSNGVPTARRRLVGLLARRGYSADLARQVVDEALAEYGAEQDGGWSDF